MIWLFSLTVAPLFVVLAGLLARYVCSTMFGGDKAGHVAFALVFGFLAGKGIGGESFTAAELAPAIGTIGGLAVLFWILFLRGEAHEKA